MTSNLRLELSTSKAVAVVNNETGKIVSEDRTDATYGNIVNGMWTPTSCVSTGACAMNGSTMYVGNYDSWYYSYYAATAGSGTADMTYDDARYSICPNGWRLPSNYAHSPAASKKSFGSITKVYLGFAENTYTDTGYQVMQSFPLHFQRAGYVDSGTYSDNNGGYFRSSTAIEYATHASVMDVTPIFIGPQGYYHKYGGFNVRCVAV